MWKRDFYALGNQENSFDFIVLVILWWSGAEPFMSEACLKRNEVILGNFNRKEHW